MNDVDNASLYSVAWGVRFATVLADIPWPSKTRAPKPESKAKWLSEHTRPQYATMKLADIIALPVNEIAAPDAILVLWVTWMHLPLAFKVIEAWGFKYATGMPWLKITQRSIADMEGVEPIYGPGPWFQHCTELILIARRGHPFGAEGNPRPARKGIIMAPRQGHSRKPDELQRWIDAKFPGPKLEMFARRQRAGWTVWGDQV